MSKKYTVLQERSPAELANVITRLNNQEGWLPVNGNVTQYKDQGPESNNMFSMLLVRDVEILIVLVENIVPESGPGAIDGMFAIQALGGTGNYEFSLDDITYTPANLFDSLGAGDYTAYAKDDEGNKGQANIRVTSM